MDTKSKISQNVQVAVRIRNHFVNTANEKKVNYDGTAVVVKAESFDSIKKTFSSVVIHDPEKRKGTRVFAYDRVFNKNDSQEQVFAVVKPIIDRCMEGFNGCIFAYGQTGSGKTYTMQGSDLSNERGVMPRVIEQITAAIADGEKKGIEYNVTGSYLEIYQEQLRDLLVSDEEQGGNINKKRSKIHLIDLAGSERVESTGATGTRLKEGSSINMSLSSLGNVINALSSGNTHIPYRDSKLTYLLSDSLGGNSITLILAISYDETIGTLKFAERAKKVKNNAIINLDPQSRK
ncbi:hypothetical protein HK103_004379 [Boothiomyces macroporosus]|uniref:Kinesin-like protein n=1 Tax=Boothiomyces macroporosus TaxID=261099 RepID=A0AAD5UGM7_9FUNG|nr:hypothetical protein HK103_004379 [Boothiomyces macroporosus]